MSKNYDNWERLVGAVLRRESDRRLAYIHSCNYSSISVSTLDLSFNSNAQFDEDDDDDDDADDDVESNNYNNDAWEKLARVVLQRDEGEMQTQAIPLLERIQYSDLQTLHHSNWNTMLLPHQQQVVWRSASLIFFPDTRLRGRGKNCFLVGSKNIQVLNDQPRKFKSNYSKSRFSEVLEIYDPEINHNVGCRIKTLVLSPNTLYVAYLVFEFTEKYAGVPLAARSTLKILPYNSVYRSKDQDRTVRFELGIGRLDGWMEVELGDFYVYPGDEDREVQVGLTCFDEFIINKRRVRFVIEGIEFRPSTDNGLFSNLHKLDGDRPSPPTQKGQLLPIRTGNNSLMLGARALLISFEDNSLCWKWTTHDHSRFDEVVRLKYVWWLKICGKINTRMLSPKIDYAAFLVFNLADGCRGLEQAKGMVRFLDNESEDDAEKGARILNLFIAVSRADGWMEIEMGNFHVDQGNEREVEAQLFEFRCYLKSGLIVEGIEFRPV